MPDIMPSFVTKRHEYFGTFDEVKGKLRKLVVSGRECNDRVFWRRVGEILHYIADYFTFPHNRTFDGTLVQHNSYEKHLKNQLKAFVAEGRADVYTVQNLRFLSSSHLIAYIEKCHKIYLNCKRDIEQDIHYILSVCYQVFQGIYQLCGRNSDMPFEMNVTI